MHCGSTRRWEWNTTSKAGRWRRTFDATGGESAVRTRLLDRSLPYAWLVRLGRIGIVPLLTGKILTSWWDCIRCGRAYGIRWYELPVVMMASVGINLLELPGMLTAFRNDSLTETCFR